MFRPSSLHRIKAIDATLHLPRSTLPVRPLRVNAVEYMKRCTDDLYSWQKARPLQAVSGDFTLHDGPPYANGDLHAGHALNKITKDIICRFQLGQGKKVSYIPGWDCHGLPIELKALQKLDSATSASVGPVETRKLARQLAEQVVRKQMHHFRQWAIMADWDNAYKSMDEDFVLRQLRLFKSLVDKGLVYRQYRPVYWSPSSVTALAEAELEYDEQYVSTAAFVKFPVTKLHDKIPHVNKPISALVWTTTPWTIPANQAIAINKNLQYCLVEEPGSAGERLCLVARSPVGKLHEKLSCSSPLQVIVDSIQGSSLIGRSSYMNPFHGTRGTPQPFVHADLVEATTGTGLVHMAPGHGMEDYKVCSTLGITLSSPVDDQSRYTVDACPHSPQLLAGLDVLSDGSQAVLEYLRCPPASISNGHTSFLLATHEYHHKYPIDWRTKKPVIVRATEQWFADLGAIRSSIAEALQEVTFKPKSSESRLRNSVLGRMEWCISRQRAWGVPIPALYHVNDGGEWDAVMTSQSIAHIIKLIEERGVDAWWSDPEDDSSWIAPELDGRHLYRRGKDTMDVWFDSGTSWTLLSGKGPTRHVADVYLEGSDQHRGWFQSSLLTYAALQSGTQQGEDRDSISAPYRILITHGFALDHNGQKMSKSVGNVITPAQIISGEIAEQQRSNTSDHRRHEESSCISAAGDKDSKNDEMGGADILRLWVASCDYTKDVLISQHGIRSVHQNMKKIRATLKWILGVLNPIEPALAAVDTAMAKSQFADTLILHRLGLSAHAVHAAYGKYDHARAIATINHFINQDLSAFYFETAKDRLYAGSPTDRAAAQNTLLLIFDQTLRMIGPATPMLVEEVLAHTPLPIAQLLDLEQKAGNEPEWHPLRSKWRPFALHPLDTPASRNLSKQYEVVLGVRSAVHGMQNLARTQGNIGSSLECAVRIEVPSATLRDTGLDLFASLEGHEWSNLLVVSHCEIQNVEGQMNDNGVRALGRGTPSWSYRAPIYDKEHLVDGIGMAKTSTYGRPIAMAVVYAAPGYKCARCWRRTALDVDTMCTRCKAVHEKMGNHFTSA